LRRHHVRYTNWKKLTPKSEFYFLIPRDEKSLAVYQKYTKITDIFPVNSVGVVTSRDKFAISADKEELKRRIRMFQDEGISDSMIKQTFDLKDKKVWTVKNARTKIKAEESWEKQIIPILYRPFDQQWIFYNDAVIERTRKEVMHNMMHENLALVGMRQYAYDVPLYNYAFVTDQVTESRIFISNKGIANIFPLYLYPDEDLYNNSGKYQHEVNINPQILETLKKAYRKEPTPEAVLYYIYAVLYSNTYRKKYAEFLKSDFPRIPLCRDYKLFQKMVKLGGKLVELHLTKSSILNRPTAKFEGKGDNLVQDVKYDEKKKLVWINAGRHFGPISKDVWDYQIGGYQVMAKWLKDRKGRRLPLEDIKHYCKIATAIRETISVQKNVDKIYTDVEKHYRGI
jgi:predicted helicase